MKKILIFSVFSLATNVGWGINSPSPVEIAKSTFWQAPYKTEIKSTIEAFNTPSLIEDCAQFRKNIFADDGTLNFTNKEMIELLRSTPGRNSIERSFVVYFKLPATIFDETNSEIASSLLSKIPHYNQTSSRSRIEIADLNSFSLRASPGSFTDTFEKLGLKPHAIKRVYRDQIPMLAIEGRDSVCDFIENNAIVTASGFAEVTIPTQSQIQLTKFYDAVATITTNALGLDKSNTNRTLLIGHRLGLLISPIVNTANHEDSLLALFNVLFVNDSLQLSGAWTFFGDQKYLVVSGSSTRSPVQIEFSKER